MTRHGEVDAKSTAKRLLCLGDHEKPSGFRGTFSGAEKTMKIHENKGVKRCEKYIVNTCWTYLFSKILKCRALKHLVSLIGVELGSFALEQYTRIDFLAFDIHLSQRNCLRLTSKQK